MPQWQPGPRLAAPPIPSGDVVVEAPPEIPRAVPQNPVLRLLPVLMLVAVAGMIALFVSTGVGLARNPATLLFPAMMLVSSIGMMAYGGRGGTRTAEVDESRKDYLRYLTRLRDDIVRDAERQRHSLSWQHPEPAALWTLAGTQRMWERDRTDSDYCHVRVGLGAQRSARKLISPDLGPADQLEPVGAAALRDVVRAHCAVGDLPIALALARFSVIEVDGNADLAAGLLRAMVCQLATLHDPRSLTILAVADDTAEDEWDWLKWLPHHQHPRLADAGGPVRLRYSALAEALSAVGGPNAHTVVVVDGGDVSGADRLPDHGVTLLGRGPCGASTRTSLRLRASPGELAVAGDENEVFARPDFMSIAEADVCARRLARYGHAGRLSTAATAGTWPELLGIGAPGSIEHTELWRNRGPHARLRVPIGIAADGSAVELDLKEAAENGMGPHGLCVGATGSGKSEFLRSLTLGLITTHPPDSLNLVLVDFKGGATFLGFERIRHVAALITNLAGEAQLVARMKHALAGEMNRRQELLRAARFSSVADYELARAAGARLAPLPALVVIVDEFSELLDQHPDFAEMFVAIGRLGRSLRMHLLLATQRLDEGRLRGLESHLSYRVCLKTFSAAESRAVIGVPDAFHLPIRPGAAYLRVGSEDPRAFQTAYTAALCVADHPARRSANAPRALNFTSAPMGAVVEAEPVTTGRTVLETVLDRLAGRGTAAHRVWLAPLAESPTLDALLPTRGSARLGAPIGVVDKPFEQRRDPLWVELDGAAGNVVIVGAPLSGKSTAVRTLVTALAATYSPREVAFYCLDFGGGGLASLAPIPHVGAVAGRNDTDLVRRTVAEISAVLRSREAVFRRLGVDSMAEYRSRRAAGDPDTQADPFGDVFLVVDGWQSLRVDFDALDAQITALAAQGLSFGVHVVLTASRWAEIRPALKDQLATRIELRLGDPADSEVNRKAAQHVPPGRPGRGITVAGNHMLIALPRLDGRPTADELSSAIAEAAATMRSRYGGQAAPPVRLLPPRVDHAELVAQHVQRPGLVLGLDETDLAPVTFDFGRHQHAVVIGDNECGKTAALRLFCAELMRTAGPDRAQLMIVDYRRTLLGVVESAHLTGYAMSGSVLDTQLPALLERLRARIPGPDVDQQQLRTRSWWSGPDLYLVVDDYDLVATSAGNPLHPLLELLPHAKDLGLHLIIARRSGGAGRALFEPLLARIRELGCAGLMMSASPDEGVLLGTTRPCALPQGRARLVTRAGERIVQLGWVAPCQ